MFFALNAIKMFDFEIRVSDFMKCCAAQAHLADKSSRGVFVRANFQNSFNLNGSIVLDKVLAFIKIDDEDIVRPVGIGLAEGTKGYRLSSKNEKICLGLERWSHKPLDYYLFTIQMLHLFRKLQSKNSSSAIEFVKAKSIVCICRSCGRGVLNSKQKNKTKKQDLLHGELLRVLCGQENNQYSHRK